ncbi:hypothetical protein MCEMSEM23_01086 [Rhabdaerophilaceae bacterium]
MNLPISTTIMVAALTVLRLLCFAIAALFLLLALRAQFDPAVSMPWGTATFAALVFAAGGAFCGWLRGVINARANGG